MQGTHTVFSFACHSARTVELFGSPNTFWDLPCCRNKEMQEQLAAARRQQMKENKKESGVRQSSVKADVTSLLEMVSEAGLASSDSAARPLQQNRQSGQRANGAGMVLCSL
jgi:hypothetical protein